MNKLSIPSAQDALKLTNKNAIKTDNAKTLDRLNKAIRRACREGKFGVYQMVFKDADLKYIGKTLQKLGYVVEFTSANRVMVRW